jgi:hypothetical protein
MRMTRKLVSLSSALVALFGVASAVNAQTCAAPINVNALVGTTTPGNTCAAPTGTGANTIGTYCGAINSSETEIIYQVTLGAGATGTFVLSNVQAGFNPAIILFTAADATACLAANNCTNAVDSAGVAAGETLPFTGNAAGSYYIAVTGSSGSGTCGSFNLTVNPTLPVQLQKFSVE